MTQKLGQVEQFSMTDGEGEPQDGMIKVLLFVALVVLLAGIVFMWYELATDYNVMNFFHFPVQGG